MSHAFENWDIKIIQNSVIHSVVIILLVTAAAKFVSAAGSNPILALPDDLLGISTRSVLVIGGALELLVIIALAIVRSELAKLSVIAWLGSIFAFYRLGKSILPSQSYCPCLGTITQQLGIAEPLAERLMLGVFAYLFIGSVTFIAFEIFSKRAKERLNQKWAY